MKKIKVSNGQELIQKAKEYKNSGGEWKLLENYVIGPVKGQINQERGWSLKNNSEGIKISNGKQEVDIYFEGLEGRINFNLTDEWKEIKQIFPEIEQTIFGDDPFYQFNKIESKEKDKVRVSRALNAWSVGDIFKIICDYCKENRAEIKKTIASSDFETSLKKWVKVGNDNKGNIFIWLGKREEENINLNGGGELQISINRKDLEQYSTSDCSRGGTIFWKDLNNQQLANELLEMRIEPFWGLVRRGRKKGAISAYDDHQVGFTPITGSNLDSFDKENYSPSKDNKKSLNLPKNRVNQISSSDKNQLLQYFLTYHITKITLDNGQLVVEYDNSQKGQKEVNKSELEKYEEMIKRQPSRSLSLSDLQKTNSNSQNPKNPNNHQLAIGLVIGTGVVILGGIVVHFVRKRNKK